MIENNKNQLILFFDIDGTIIDSFNGNSIISDLLREAFRQLKENGHLCFIATGRPLAYLNDEILSIDFDGFVLCNGAIVIKDQQVIKESLFPKDVVSSLVHIMDKNNNVYFLNYLKEVYFSKNGIEQNELFGNEVIENGIIYHEYDLNNIKVAKIEINNLEEKTTTYLKKMQALGYEVVWYPGLDYAEITMPHATKGEAIKQVLKLLDISRDNSIAFGDGDNDIEMLKVVGHGVAMGNGSKSVKEVADMITDTCLNEGIVKELQRLKLVKNII